MDDNILTVRDLKNFFNLIQITGNETSLTRPILVADTNRPGLELAGFTAKSDLNRVVLLGQKEIAYISTLSDAMLRKRFGYLTSEKVPCIIVCHGETVPERLVKIAHRKNFPVFFTDTPTNMMVVDVVGFLDDKLARFDNVHGVLMNIYGKGILITGESGIGKSELALELISRGHVLVADDRVDCYRIHNRIIGTAPEVIQRYLEIRGVGIINVVEMFGARSYLERAQIDYTIHLEPYNETNVYDRLGNADTQRDILGISVPEMILPVKEGRNMAVLVESAVTNFSLKQIGYNTAEMFREALGEKIMNKEGK